MTIMIKPNGPTYDIRLVCDLVETTAISKTTLEAKSLPQYNTSNIVSFSHDNTTNTISLLHKNRSKDLPLPYDKGTMTVSLSHEKQTKTVSLPHEKQTKSVSLTREKADTRTSLKRELCHQPTERHQVEMSKTECPSSTTVFSSDSSTHVVERQKTKKLDALPLCNSHTRERLESNKLDSMLKPAGCGASERKHVNHLTEKASGLCHNMAGLSESIITKVKDKTREETRSHCFNIEAPTEEKAFLNSCNIGTSFKTG